MPYPRKLHKWEVFIPPMYRCVKCGILKECILVGSNQGKSMYNDRYTAYVGGKTITARTVRALPCDPTFYGDSNGDTDS